VSLVGSSPELAEERLEQVLWLRDGYHTIRLLDVPSSRDIPCLGCGIPGCIWADEPHGGGRLCGEAQYRRARYGRCASSSVGIAKRKGRTSSGPFWL